MRLLLTSKLLPVPHGFSLREGGTSEGAFASLNLGFGVGDDAARVTENHRRLAAAANLGPGALHTVRQVHGAAVVEVPARQEGPGALPQPFAEADALHTARAGEAVGVKTADCVPILLVDPDTRRVAAIHSGWRGTDADISARAVEALVARGARADRLLAAVGPAIQICCYEVSPELGQRFRSRFGADIAVEEEGKVHLDLPGAVKQTLLGAGMREAHIEVLLECTACKPERYFSHRRDRGLTGRHLNFVASVF